MSKFIATFHAPGCLPDSTEPPPVFNGAGEAWRYLLDELGDDAWSPDDPNDPDGPQSLTPFALTLQAWEERRRPGTAYGPDGYVYEVDYAPVVQLPGGTVAAETHDVAYVAEFDHEHAKAVAAWWQSSGTIGHVLASFTSGHEVALSDLLADIANTIIHDKPNETDRGDLEKLKAYAERVANN